MVLGRMCESKALRADVTACLHERLKCAGCSSSGRDNEWQVVNDAAEVGGDFLFGLEIVRLHPQNFGYLSVFFNKSDQLD